MDEATLELIIPIGCVMLWIVIVIIAVYVTYYCLRKRPQRYRVVPAENLILRQQRQHHDEDLLGDVPQEAFA